MCGIAGFFDPTRGMDVLHGMTDAIATRGPDDNGHYLADGVGLGHRRLSILDLSPLGHQPMRFEHLVTVYNGEIYNFREVAEELSAKGYSFASSSDTEVLLKAFHCWGPRCVERFTGMFAIAMWDERERALYLIRDRAGVKPLYYTERDGRVAFASTLKALRPYLSPEDRNTVNPLALSDFLSLGYVGSDASILAAVKKLPPGHYLKFSNGRTEMHRYWQAEFHPDPAMRGRSLDDVVDELEAIAIKAFRYRMVSDVPVGVFLSAGVDSSLVTAMLTKHHGPLRTFTIGFSENGYDESAGAAKIAAHLGTEHSTHMLSAERGAQILDNYYDIFDEPHGDSSGVATAYVSEVARDAGVKVVLSADGGDELFGGYTRYLEFLHRWNQTARLGGTGRTLASTAFRMAGGLAPGFRGETLRRQAEILTARPFLNFMVRRLRTAGAGDMRRLYPEYRERPIQVASGDLLSQMSGWDFENYMVDDVLVKVDRATMYHSLEGREPMLDQRLVEFAGRLPSEYKIKDGRTKVILKALLDRYLPKPLWDLPKRGFAPPIVEWTRDRYRDRFAEVLDTSDSLFDATGRNALLERYRRGQPVNHPLIWHMYNFQSWFDHWKTAA
jgi:asparagine synthase (glutamine-hydrolysing)